MLEHKSLNIKSQKIKIEAACNKLDTKIAEFEDR